MPPSWQRYPLPTSQYADVPHRLDTCGDPDWCRHEEGTGLEIQRAVVPSATAPKIFGPTSYHVLREDLPEMLLAEGFSGHKAHGLAVVFYEGDQPAIDRPKEGFRVAGFYNGFGYMDKSADADEGVWYPLAVHIRNSPRQKRSETDQIIWHELGHALRDDSNPDIAASEPNYQNDATVRRIRVASVATAVTSSVVDVAVFAEAAKYMPQQSVGPTLMAGAIGLIFGTDIATRPRSVAWSCNREERWCERYAKQHKRQPLILE